MKFREWFEESFSPSNVLARRRQENFLAKITLVRHSWTKSVLQEDTLDKYWGVTDNFLKLCNGQSSMSRVKLGEICHALCHGSLWGQNHGCLFPFGHGLLNVTWTKAMSYME